MNINMNKLITGNGLKVFLLLLNLMFFFNNEAFSKKQFPRKFQKKGKTHGQWHPEGMNYNHPYTTALKVGSFNYINFRLELGRKLFVPKDSAEFQFKKTYLDLFNSALNNAPSVKERNVSSKTGSDWASANRAYSKFAKEAAFVYYINIDKDTDAVGNFKALSSGLRDTFKNRAIAFLDSMDYFS